MEEVEVMAVCEYMVLGEGTFVSSPGAVSGCG